ncbi:PREDICTED: cas scaffolding protein family member 4 [Pseudopodoces humilis]|uniref:cas scaffolding protein family member 4 n=1 Tax=Pseudopodoces humilis TaxID=181119 RepID=UPI0006B7C549|nr:PREDICTED: cas scaffolding protein family member 4 [Pseudopodoces humilis]
MDFAEGDLPTHRSWARLQCPHPAVTLALLQVGMTTMDVSPRSSTAAKHSLAKALYDNKAESCDELAFRRGDILTVLEQHVPGSEGWWRCSLHGHRGLAPANRLQLLPPGPASGQHPTEPPTAHNIYQVPSVPSVPKATALSATYEKMEGWVQPPAVPAQAVYQVPALAAQLLSERTKRSTHQHLFTLPRACRASAPNIRGEVYDVPSSQHRGSLLPQSAATPPSTRKCSVLGRSTESFQAEQKKLYNIPSKPEKAGAGSQKDSAAGNLYDVPPKRELDDSENKSQKKCWGHYNTLPNPRKSEWIYDIPVSPENSGFKANPPGQCVEKQVLYDIPPARYKAPATATEAKVGNAQLYHIPPPRRKLMLPEIPLYDVPSSRDVLLLPQNGSSEVPLSLLAAKAESQISEENIYDIPKGLPSAGHSKKEMENNSDQAHGASPQLSVNAKSENDSLCVSSVDSRSSTLTSSSSSSAESSSTLSPSAEPLQEIKLELEAAIETLTRLQHGVSSSIASLMIFVSSKWRLQEHLEKSLEEIHRAVDHIKVSMGEFLAFAQALKGNASNLTDNNLQARIKKQLEILTNSYKILTETREALNSCSWSLEALVLRKPQNNPDDLDRFVMVARTIPDDIKRFVSIIIANGKLLFRKNQKEQEKKQPKVNPECKMAKQIPAPRRVEIESLQRNAAEKSSQSQVPMQKPEGNSSEDCDYVQLQVLPCAKKTENPSRQEPARKIPLPEHCRLCFAALHKAIGVFTTSLSNQQPPEIFISHSKLIIMVGQKLVDSLCQETQEREARSDVLHSSSRFCSLLKNLALATKTAALKYPSAEATRELREQTEELAKYTQQFRAMMD